MPPRSCSWCLVTSITAIVLLGVMPAVTGQKRGLETRTVHRCIACCRHGSGCG